MKAFKGIGKMVGNLDLNKGVAAVIAAFGVLGSIIVGLVESAKGMKAEDDIIEGECDLLNHNQEESEKTEENEVESADEPTEPDEA